MPRQTGRRLLALRRPTHAPRHDRNARSRLSRGYLRGVLVNPWFAAGAGFVIAVSLALKAPRFNVIYSPFIGACASSRCGIPSGEVPNALATDKAGIPLRVPSDGTSKPTGQPGHSVAKSTTVVTYQLLWQARGTYSTTIVVNPHQSLAKWTLSFTLAGSRIMAVWGAAWQPNSNADGGVASAQSLRGSWRLAETDFVVLARGATVAPTACVLNGSPCVFRPLSKQSSSGQLGGLRLGGTH